MARTWGRVKRTGGGERKIEGNRGYRTVPGTEGVTFTVPYLIRLTSWHNKPAEPSPFACETNHLPPRNLCRRGRTNRSAPSGLAGGDEICPVTQAVGLGWVSSPLWGRVTSLSPHGTLCDNPVRMSFRGVRHSCCRTTRNLALR
jgi:hypothetical protein